jgi:hypothetical protein
MGWRPFTVASAPVSAGAGDASALALEQPGRSTNAVVIDAIATAATQNSDGTARRRSIVSLRMWAQQGAYREPSSERCASGRQYDCECAPN